MVVGLGSPHGDDQAGWQVIDLLAAQIADVCELRKAKVPHELIDWLGDLAELHVVDACVSDPQRSTFSRFQMVVTDRGLPLLTDPRGATASLPRLRSGNSHQIDFGAVMQLAKQLDRLPPEVTVWTIPGRTFSPDKPVSPACQTQIADCAETIASEIAGSQR